MPTIILKVSDGTDDFYALWSTVIDAPIGWGDRKFLQENTRGLDGDRFDRADRTGTSCFLGTGEWGRPLTIHTLGHSSGPWKLERHKLSDFIYALDELEDGDKNGEEDVIREFTTRVQYDD